MRDNTTIETTYTNRNKIGNFGLDAKRKNDGILDGKMNSIAVPNQVAEMVGFVGTKVSNLMYKQEEYVRPSGLDLKHLDRQPKVPFSQRHPNKYLVGNGIDPYYIPEPSAVQYVPQLWERVNKQVRMWVDIASTYMPQIHSTKLYY